MVRTFVLNLAELVSLGSLLFLIAMLAKAWQIG